MNSNNDNKEKLTEDNEEVTSSAENENIEKTENNGEEENLLEITNGEIEYPQERVSLADAIKYAFDMDEVTSEGSVVEDADDEVVFVAPDRIINYIEDYLNHMDDEETDDAESNVAKIERFVPSGGVYFSTAETEALPPVESEEIAEAEISEETEESEEAEEIAEAEIPEETEESEEAEEIAEAEIPEETQESEEVEEIAEAEITEETEESEEVEEIAEAEISEETEESEEAEEIAEAEISEETQESEEVEKIAEAEIPEEDSEADVVDLFEMADNAANSPESEVSEKAEAETDIDDGDDEELPAIFMQGSESAAESEGDGIEEAESEADDAEDAPAITVHRHCAQEEGESTEESEDSEYEEMFGTGDTPDETVKKPHGLSAWAKKKTAGGWVKFALKCVGVLLLMLCVTAVLYVNGKLDLINYRDASDFEQYYNLSDTDYVSSSDEVYENPLHYNSSTTLEGFDESMIDIPKEDVINVLLIGTDIRGGTYEDRGNTDSMILLSINTRDKNIKLTSFMRDMYVTIPGRGKNRINAAYAYGGPQLLFDTLKENFDVDVDLYARVNFANFKKIIDQVGGIEMELTQAEANYMNKYAYKYNTDPVEAGLQTLDGAQALSYARCRKIDSDFGRTERQRKVLVAFVDKIKGSSLTELDGLLNTLLPMIQTNMPKMQIVSLMVDALSYLNNEVETLNIPIKNSWQSVTIRKMSVLCPNFELNKTAIVAHIYSTYKLDVESTMYQSFEVPKGDTATKQKTTTTAATTTAPSIAEDTTTTTEPTESTQSSTTTKKTYWWDRTTTTSTMTTTRSSQSTTTTAPPSTTTAAPPQNQGDADEAA